MKKIIRKSKIGWIINDDIMTAFDKLQATSYHVYELTNRHPFDMMKKKVLKSTPSELNSWVDILDLAAKQGLKGYGTRLRSEWFES